MVRHGRKEERLGDARILRLGNMGDNGEKAIEKKNRRGTCEMKERKREGHA